MKFLVSKKKFSDIVARSYSMALQFISSLGKYLQFFANPLLSQKLNKSKFGGCGLTNSQISGEMVKIRNYKDIFFYVTEMSFFQIRSF